MLCNRDARQLNSTD